MFFVVYFYKTPRSKRRSAATLCAHPLKMERPIKKVTNYKKAEAHNRERGRVGGGRNEMK